jgi:glycosyltransferase involved in cell wall biosynthesis
MKHSVTVSIGIPAHNEEANIGVLLKHLLRQKETHGILAEIIVVSDGSDDQTVRVAKAVKDKRIQVIDRKKRLGMNKTQNEIIRRVKGDILVMLNADVVPVNEYLLDELIQPMIHDKRIGLVGGNTVPVYSKTFVEWALNTGHNFKQSLYRQLNNSETLYLCHGRVRAFSRALYKKIKWPEDCPEDAYSFLLCRHLGFKFVFVGSGSIHFRSPQTIQEHARQSLRFRRGQDRLLQYFPRKDVLDAYCISKSVLLRTIIWYFFTHPLSMASYVMISIITRLFYSHEETNLSKWEIAHTSKRVI